ncbi:hypothetical protein RBH29_07240 [Herbivorax sp. ANBcel31]|uniref:hypothetical protein n=1 Tax=Herbivorax sp. ANBcel31 TaxID=3069754 RepID=UPI0027B2E445|nr:hypothetical protein [Herbivorax sp. ANBcel31]MDQ2086222.1 hypothetical protein [Herbivorax sp. ANBcel31]
MKLKFLSIIIFLLITTFLTPVFAGDLPESAMMFADYGFIGTVQEVDDTKVTLDISEVLFGNYDEKSIQISKFEYVKGYHEKAEVKVGDYCAAIVMKTDDSYDIWEFLVAKADSLEKETLKLDSNNQFIIRMNTYINDGFYSNENFYKMNPNAHLQHLDDNVNEENSSDEKTSDNEENLVLESQIDSSENNFNHFKTLRYALITIIIVLLLVVTVVLISNEKKTKKMLED